MPKLAPDLLRFGIPMGVEKPLGPSAEQIAPLVEEVARRNAFVAVPLDDRSPRDRYAHFGEDALKRLKAGQRSVASVEDCYRAVRLLDAIYTRAAASR